VPEAPRTIFDALTTLDRLPFGVHARAECEYVVHKFLDVGNTRPPRTVRGNPGGRNADCSCALIPGWTADAGCGRLDLPRLYGPDHRDLRSQLERGHQRHQFAILRAGIGPEWLLQRFRLRDGGAGRRHKDDVLGRRVNLLALQLDNESCPCSCEMNQASACAAALEVFRGAY
jgi:hypothetical protein